MQTACIKCGHVNHQASGAADEACPRCHVIYAKARPTAVARPRVDGRASGFSASTMHGDSAAPFLERLRSESHYPTFRMVVRVLCWLGYLLGTAIFIGFMTSGWRLDSGMTMFGGTLAACLVVVFAKAAREASLMLADMSDATVRMAQRQDSANGF